MAPVRMSLNDLPDNAVAEILSHLPIKDAVRTSVLSSSWRRSWQHCPGLVVSGISIGEVSMVLLLHSGSVRLFKAEEAHSRQRWRYHDIHGWLAALARHSASTLLTLILSFPVYNHEQMTLNIVHIARDFPNLVHLDLSCTLNVPLQFRGFAALRSLRIHNCCHYGGHASTLISACPLLETLTMMNVDGLQCLDIVAPNLRSLELLNLRFTDFSIMSAPLLEAASIRLCMFLVGVGGGIDNEDGDDEVNEDGDDEVNEDDEDGDDEVNEDDEDEVNEDDDVSESEDVGIGVNDNDDVGNGGSDNEDVSGGSGADSKNISLMKVFQSMAPSIKKLELDHDLLTFLGRGHVPERIPINLDYLRVVSMEADLGDMRAVLATLCLLRSAPNLRELVITRWKESNKVLETGDDFWESQGHTDLFNKLETVTISSILYEEVELGFIQFLLAKARMLKTMTIGFDKHFRNEMSAMTMLLGFPRVSSQARILLTS